MIRMNLGLRSLTTGPRLDLLERVTGHIMGLAENTGLDASGIGDKVQRMIDDGSWASLPDEVLMPDHYAMDLNAQESGRNFLQSLLSAKTAQPAAVRMASSPTRPDVNPATVYRGDGGSSWH